MKEYKVMMLKDGKWWNAHINGHKARITTTHENAIAEMERVKEGRNRWGHPADDYKIVVRDVTEWMDT